MGAGSTFSQGANANTVNPFAGATNPYAQAANATTLANLAGAQLATSANRVNQNTPYANLSYTKSVDANGNPIWSANQSLNPMFQGTLSNLAQNTQQATQNNINASDYQLGSIGQGPQFNQIGSATQASGVNPAQSASMIGNAENLQKSVGGTGTQGWDAATQMIMNRLQPQMAQQAESQKAALANQGIVSGTQAYDNAMRTFNQQQNDLLTSAQMQGANLQNQLFNQNIAAGQFGNQAITQQNQNQLANLGFNNQAVQQNYANSLSGQQLANQAAQQNYANQLAGLQFNNQAAQQGYANQLSGLQANNAAMQSNFANRIAAQNAPLQQLGAFQSATTPGYVNPYSQAAVSGPDYLGAYTTSNAAQIAAQNAKNAQTANLQNGLFGLGSSAILGAGGIGNLGTSILNGATTLGGLLGLGGQSSANYMNSIGATGSGMFDQSMSSNDYLNNLYGDLGIF